MTNRPIRRSGFLSATLSFSVTLCAVVLAWFAGGLMAVPALEAQLLKPAPPPAEPTSPAARHFKDSRYGVSFQLPAGWNFTRRDGELSTFHLDARSAPRSALLRAVTDLSFNPYPLSTFSGALVYSSVSPHSTDAACANEAVLPLHRPETRNQINGVTFVHGHDEHGDMCIESRDEVYTTYRHKACYRFDLVMNTFCGGDAGGGARDMTKSEMDNILARQVKILNSVVLKP
jgi:hypothetical protein